MFLGARVPIVALDGSAPNTFPLGTGIPLRAGIHIAAWPIRWNMQATAARDAGIHGTGIGIIAGELA
jgi:hypothetical protein